MSQNPIGGSNALTPLHICGYPSKEDRELTLPALVRAGWIDATDGRVGLHQT